MSDTAERVDAVAAATRLHAKVLRAHPFVDGNLRGTTVALNAGLVTLDLDVVAFKDLALHDELLGVVNVTNRAQHGLFVEEDVERVRLLGLVISLIASEAELPERLHGSFRDR